MAPSPAESDHTTIRKIRFRDINPLPNLFTIGPANRDHEVGIRCGISVFVPLITLLLIDRVDLAIFASFGAFTAIYGRNMPHGTRLQAQLRAGILMLSVLCAATLAGRAGISEAENPWGLVALTSMVAGICTAIVSYWELRPSGSLFHIFAFAAVASVPNQPPFWDAMLTAALTVVLSLLIGISARVLKSHRHPWEWPKKREMTKPDWQLILGESLWYIVAAGIAGSVATLFGPLIGIEHNYWAMVANVVPLVGHSTRYRVSRGLQRIIGSFVGLLIMALIFWMHPPMWLLIIFIALLQCGAELFIARHYAIAQALVTPLALMSTVLGVAGTTGKGFPSDAAAQALLADRFIETVIGSFVGMICVLFPWFWRKFVMHREDPARTGIIPTVKKAED